MCFIVAQSIYHHLITRRSFKLGKSTYQLFESYGVYMSNVLSRVVYKSSVIKLQKIAQSIFLEWITEEEESKLNSLYIKGFEVEVFIHDVRPGSSKKKF